ncbi:NYN domain-containing protein [Vallitalea sp.]|uniref:NYN domain-containing protein n=1 Tax=Vallitalea sp. TaxID=1882829 RepID=UPI0025FC5173|nr:NYN domain-containing protein [Vallitalea sp.]MCT4686433.1 NYN domain-containing protein [Vallitalea sp.]
MTREFLLVDGYNIIYAWDKLKRAVEEESLEIARKKLLDIMSNYQGYKKIEVIVVFDAHRVKGTRKIEKYNNIDVVFTKEVETADHYIEKVAHSIGRDYRVRVATSDGLEQTIILGKGASRISARELHNEVNMIESDIRKNFIEKVQIDNNRLEGHLDPKVLEWMEKMRRE